MKNNILQKNSPSGWREVRLGDVADISAGGTPSTTVSAYWNHGNVPWAKSGEINKRRIYKTENFITKLGLEESSAKIVPENSVLIALAGQGSTRGKVAINNISLATNQSIAFFVPASKLDYRFLFLDLDRRYAELRSISAGDGGRGGLNLSLLKSLKIKLPEISEQKRIVAVLETWDQAIEKLVKRIKAKRNIKNGLAQQLLSGKKRLPGFEEEWETYKVGNFIDGISERNRRNQVSRVLSVTNKHGFILAENQFARVVASEDKSNYKVINKGDFAYNPSRINVGSISRLDDFENGILSPMYVAFRPKENISSDFLYHWLFTSEANGKVRSCASGSVRESVDFKSFCSIKIKVPNLDEQIAISKVLTTANEEIKTLEKELNILKEQKKFLLNNLITGQIRVPACVTAGMSDKKTSGKKANDRQKQ